MCMPAAAAATLISPVWPFRRQRLAFHNEFPSGAADLNVTHSQRQFELGDNDVWADKWTACFCSFFNLIFLL